MIESAILTSRRRLSAWRTLALFAPFATVTLFTLPAAAESQQLFNDCVALLNSGSIPEDATAPRMPLSFASNVGFTVPSRVQGQVGATSCYDLTWVKVPTTPNATNFNAKIFWAGRTAQNGWDCAHSTLAWGVYKKWNGSWTFVNGGSTYGYMPQGTLECSYDNSSGIPGWGIFNISDSAGSQQGEFRIAFYTWSHNEPGLGHPGTDCAYSSCNWPARFELTGARAPQMHDFAIWRPTTGVWWTLDSNWVAVWEQQWGQGGDLPVPGDYDNDGTSDYAVWRGGSPATWYVINSSTGGWWATNYGTSANLPLPADYSGDGKTDLGFRSGSSWFYIDSRTGNYVQSYIWGGSGGVGVPGNFDGDLTDDYAAYKSFDGLSTWYVNYRAGGGFQTQWGLPTDVPVSGDFNGDRKTDVAVWRPSDGTWYIVDSNDGSTSWVQWGAEGDIPMPGRYDSDNKTDLAVFRGSEHRWYFTRSSTGAYLYTEFGDPGDLPVRVSRGNGPE